MPSFSTNSSIRIASQDHILRLKITHNLVHGWSSDAVHSFKGRLPRELDVLWLSDITIMLSGSLDGQEIPAQDIVRSGLVHHLQTRLQANAERLGLSNVSHPFVDDADGFSKCCNHLLPFLLVSDSVSVMLAPSRPLPDASRPHANLVSLHLAYIWRTITGRSDTTDSGHLVEEINPFSPALFLPAETLLHRVIEQFLVYHLVSRYPLIFGPWCKRLDLEMQYFPSIGRSIMEIMTRSENRRFLSKCSRLIRIARKQHKFIFQTAAATLSSCTHDDTASDTLEEETDDPLATPVLTDEQVLCASLEQLFRMGVPQRRFKPAARVAPQSPQNDDSLLLCIPDVGNDDEDRWIELPEVATSPLTDPLSTFTDMDVFADEDWPDDGMWRVHGADVGLGEREFDEVDATLISGSISLASITTSCLQDGPVALYHRHDMDPREPDPAGGGLRYKVSQLAYLEDAETSAAFASLTHSPSHEPHDPYYSENYEQVMGYVGTCQVDTDGLETLGSWTDLDEDADSDSILFELDVADGTGFDEPLV